MSKKKKNTCYNLDKLWADCLRCFNIQDPEMKQVMAEQVAMKFKGYKMEMQRKWLYQSVIKAIMNWSEQMLKENKELYTPYCEFMFQTLDLKQR